MTLTREVTFSLQALYLNMRKLAGGGASGRIQIFYVRPGELPLSCDYSSKVITTSR